MTVLSLRHMNATSHRRRLCQTPRLIRDLSRIYLADAASNDAPYRLIRDVEFGEGVVVYSFTNIYGCRIGDGTRIGPFVEIQRGAEIGARCKIQSHAFICDGVRIEDEVFVGHGVLFINDKTPRATSERGDLQREDDWELLPTIVERGASLGSGAVIMGGIRIGAGSLVGAGAVVTNDVEAGAIVAGNPARVLPRPAMPG
jgi:UDP-2-acetamido-3-amino-2,3-dideoxy-glucuronate N-acetyltransferase